MTRTFFHISRPILEWAVTRSGKTVSQYMTEDSRYADWILGRREPTFKQAQAFAKKFYIPFSSLFFETPPQERNAIPFFRRIVNGVPDINVRDLVDEMVDRQDWLKGYMMAVGQDPCPLYRRVQSLKRDVAVAFIRERLDFDKVWGERFRTVESAINAMVDVLEDQGVVVVFKNIVGYDTHRVINVNDFRGFSLADKYAPFIVINSGDVKTAQLFTLVHELIHIVLGSSAGVGGEEDDIRDSELERFCDSVAAELLVPPECLSADWKAMSGDINKLVRKYKVSRYVILRSAKDLGFVSEEDYHHFLQEWALSPMERRRTSSNPDFYQVAIRRTSRAFLTHVTNALNGNMLSFMEAYRLVGLKGDTFHSLISNKAFLG